MLTFYQHNKTPKPFLAWQTPNCMCTCCQLKISSTFYVNEFLQNLNKTNFDQTHSYTITQNYTTAWPWSTLDKGESLACNIISPFYKKVQAKKFYIIRPWRMPVSLCTDMMGRVVSWLDRGTGVCIAVAVADSVVVGSLPGGLSFSRLATNWARSSAVEALASSDWHLRPFLRTFGDLSLTSPVPPNLPTLIVNEKRFFAATHGGCRKLSEKTDLLRISEPLLKEINPRCRGRASRQDYKSLRVIKILRKLWVFSAAIFRRCLNFWKVRLCQTRSVFNLKTAVCSLFSQRREVVVKKGVTML